MVRVSKRLRPQPRHCVGDFFGAGRQVCWRLAIVGAVEDVLVKDPGRFAFVPLSLQYSCEVESGDFLVGGGCHGDAGGGTSLVELASMEAVSDDDVSDVGDRAHHVQVEPVAFEEPSPATRSKFVKRSALDELQCLDEVGDAARTAALSAESETPEEVDVHERADDLVDADAACQCCRRDARVGEESLAGGGIGAHPVAKLVDVGPHSRRRDVEGIGNFVGGGTMRPCREICEQFGVVGLAAVKGDAGCAGAGWA